MPGPGKRGKAKSKSTKSSGSNAKKVQPESDEVFLGGIENAEEWEAIIEVACELFGLPGEHEWHLYLVFFLTSFVFSRRSHY